MKFTNRKAEEICLLVAQGHRLDGLTEVSSELPGFQIVQRWLSDHESFRLDLVEAQKSNVAQACLEIKDIADQPLDRSDPVQSKIELDYRAQRMKARQFIVSKLLPYLEKSSKSVDVEQIESIEIIDYSKEQSDE